MGSLTSSVKKIAQRGLCLLAIFALSLVVITCISLASNGSRLHWNPPGLWPPWAISRRGKTKKSTADGITSTPMSLEQVRRHNHATRKSVKTWIKRGDWEAPPSLFNYGLPASVFHLIDKDVGAIPIQVWVH